MPKMKLIPVDEIIVKRSENYRKDLGDIESLAVSIECEGLITPLLVAELDDGIHLVSGFRRYAAIKMLPKIGGTPMEKVKCIFQDGRRCSETALLITQMIENAHRKDATAYEKARAYKSLVLNKHVDVTEVAQRMGTSATTINQYIEAIGGSPVVTKAFKEGTISVTAAYEIVHNYKSEKGQEKALERQIGAGVSNRSDGSPRIKKDNRKVGVYRRVRRFKTVEHEAIALRGRKPRGPFESATDREFERGRLDGIRQALSWVMGSEKKPW